MERWQACSQVFRCVLLGMVTMSATHVEAATSPPNPTSETSPSASLTAPAVRASNTFAISCYRKLTASRSAGNVIFSPYSISRALTIAAHGARDQTRDEMAATLHLPKESLTSVHAGNRAISDRFKAAAGLTDEATRVRIAELRERLDEANTRVNPENHAGLSKARALAEELNRLIGEVDRFTLRTADALWIDRHFPIDPEFIGDVETYYGKGCCTPVDFMKDCEGVRDQINTCVEAQTEHRIKDLIPLGSLQPLTRLVITNAVYFLGDWAQPFRVEASREMPFTSPSGEKHAAMMMNDAARWGVPYAAFMSSGEYFETPKLVPENENERPATYPDHGGFTMIELPYKGGELAMVVILPMSKDGLGKLEAKLDDAMLSSCLARLDSRTVSTHIPRFTLSSELELSDTLRSMGMNRAFQSQGNTGGAQFYGLTTSRNSADLLYIGSVRQKAWIDVGEKGTEAAAATSVQFRVTSARPQKQTMISFVPVFKADHPFMFIIRDRQTGLVLFMGRIASPR